MATWSFDRAARWIEGAEQSALGDLSWDDLRAALVAVRQGNPEGGPGQWVDRVLSLIHAKAAPALGDAQAGISDEHTVNELSDAARAAQAASNVGGDPEFLDSVSTALRSIKALNARASGSSAGEATTGTESAQQADTLKQKFMAAGRKYYQTNPAAPAEPDFMVDIRLEGQWTDLQNRATAYGLTPEEAVNQQVGAWNDFVISAGTGQAIAPGSPSATLPSGFTAARQAPLDPQRIAMLGAEQGRQADYWQVDPKFVDGDEWSPAALPTEAVIRLQRQMEDAGFLTPGTFYDGFWNGDVALAYRQVLGYANVSGKKPETILKEFAANPLAQQTDKSVYQAPPFMKPDYATLAQQVKDMVQRRLGREPTDAELAQLTDKIGGFTRSQYDAEIAASRRLAEMQQTAQDTGQPQAPGVVQAVDPAARFAEMFDQRFKPEIDRLKSIDAVRQNMANVYQSISSMQSMIGG